MLSGSDVPAVHTTNTSLAGREISFYKISRYHGVTTGSSSSVSCGQKSHSLLAVYRRFEGMLLLPSSGSKSKSRNQINRIVRSSETSSNFYHIR
jgi:hypothetical protein